MTVFAVFMLAQSHILAPLELVDLRVIKLPTLESVITVLSLFLMASLKVRVMFEFLATPVAELVGLKVIVGAVVSATPISRAVKVAEDALMALFASSSTVSAHSHIDDLFTRKITIRINCDNLFVRVNGCIEGNIRATRISFL